MEHCLKLPNRYAMILDIETIKGVIAHAAELKLSRRECHPLDRYRGSARMPPWRSTMPRWTLRLWRMRNWTLSKRWLKRKMHPFRRIPTSLMTIFSMPG